MAIIDLTLYDKDPVAAVSGDKAALLESWRHSAEIAQVAAGVAIRTEISPVNDEAVPTPEVVATVGQLVLAS